MNERRPCPFCGEDNQEHLPFKRGEHSGMEEVRATRMLLAIKERDTAQRLLEAEVRTTIGLRTELSDALKREKALIEEREEMRKELAQARFVADDLDKSHRAYADKLRETIREAAVFLMAQGLGEFFVQGEKEADNGTVV